MAAEEYKRLAEAERDPSNPFLVRGFVDLDPASTVHPHPLLSAVQAVAGSWDPHGVGPIYETPDGIIRIGLTAATKRDLLHTVRTAVPDATIETFAVSRSWAQVLDIQHEITLIGIEDLSGTIVSIGADPATATVSVGCTDVDSPTAKAIAEQYGDGVVLSHHAGYEDLRPSRDP